MAKNIAETSTKNLFVFLFILNLKIKIIDKLGFIKTSYIIKNYYHAYFNQNFFHEISLELIASTMLQLKNRLFVKSGIFFAITIAQLP